MKVYRVGGCVRDRLLGLDVNDIDWVVTGATIEEMEAAGYKSIGKDFPVFLHPETKQEYALARSERKSWQPMQSRRSCLKVARPVRSWIRSIREGWMRFPPLTIMAYAVVRSSSVTSPAPSPMA